MDMCGEGGTWVAREKTNSSMLECEREGPEKKLLPEIRPAHAPDTCDSEIECVDQPPTLPW